MDQIHLGVQAGGHAVDVFPELLQVAVLRLQCAQLGLERFDVRHGELCRLGVGHQLALVPAQRLLLLPQRTVQSLADGVGPDLLEQGLALALAAQAPDA